jgi:16S rRNA C967 or C1407 C5-methylase (RsmB/RsmF family)
VVDAFLARTPGIERDGVASLLSPDAATALVRDDTLRTTPSEHDLDGFFAVRLRAAARE